MSGNCTKLFHLQITAHEKSPELITLALVTLGTFDFSGTTVLYSYLLLAD